jgi:ribosomal protein S27E
MEFFPRRKGQSGKPGNEGSKQAASASDLIAELDAAYRKKQLRLVCPHCKDSVIKYLENYKAYQCGICGRFLTYSGRLG